MKYLEEVVSVRALLPTQAVMDGLDWGHAKLRTNQVVASPPYMRFNLDSVVHDFSKNPIRDLWVDTSTFLNI